jgi:chitinase
LVHGLSKDNDQDSSSSTKHHATTSTKSTKTKTITSKGATKTKSTKQESTSTHLTKSKQTKTKHPNTKTKGTKTKTIKTKTTTTESTETSSSTKPSNGKSCSSEGKMTCSGNSFATCSSGTWSLRSCPNGLTCFDTDSGSIYCGQSEKSSKAVTVSSLALTDNKQGPIAMPYKSGRVIAQFSVKQKDEKNFSAVINAGRLDLNPFKNTVTIQFKVAHNIKVTKVANGKVTQTGNNVKLSVKNLMGETMSVLAIMDCTVISGVFSLPNINSMKFS